MFPNLREITIPDGTVGVTIENVNYDQATGGGIQELTIPNTATNILIDLEGLKTLKIGFGVSCLYDKYEGQYILLPEDRSLDIQISKDNPFFKTQDGFVLTKDGTEAVLYFGNKSSVTIPDGVTSVGEMAFYGCTNLTSVTIPDGVTNIGFSAFRDCGFTSVTIPASVTYIDEEAFVACRLLKTVNMENRTVEYVQGMENFSWGIGIYWDGDTQHDVEATVRCSDGDIALNAADTEPAN